jgi:hypothetical protein
MNPSRRGVPGPYVRRLYFVEVLSRKGRLDVPLKEPSVQLLGPFGKVDTATQPISGVLPEYDVRLPCFAFRTGGAEVAPLALGHDLRHVNTTIARMSLWDREPPCEMPAAWEPIGGVRRSSPCCTQLGPLSA